MNLARLKTRPGRYAIAFYGAAVARYQHFPEAVTAATQALQKARDQLKALTDESERGMAEAAVQNAQKHLALVTKQARPKDIADIMISEPIHIEVVPRQTTASR